jgi:hypothetical protein
MVLDWYGCDKDKWNLCFELSSRKI